MPKPKTDKLTLTPKQKAFAEFYIQCGNATEAARKAGYPEKSAKSIGNENLTKPHIRAYIDKLTAPDEEKRIADAQEVMQFYSAVMRGEVKDSFGLDAALADRLKAGDALMKRFIAMQGKAAENECEDLTPLANMLK
jgi:phage terminase small subunit